MNWSNQIDVDARIFFKSNSGFNDTIILLTGDTSIDNVTSTVTVNFKMCWSSISKALIEVEYCVHACFHSSKCVYM